MLCWSNWITFKVTEYFRSNLMSIYNKKKKNMKTTEQTNKIRDIYFCSPVQQKQQWIIAFKSVICHNRICLHFCAAFEYSVKSSQIVTWFQKFLNWDKICKKEKKMHHLDKTSLDVLKTYVRTLFLFVVTINVWSGRSYI